MSSPKNPLPNPALLFASNAVPATDLPAKAVTAIATSDRLEGYRPAKLRIQALLHRLEVLEIPPIGVHHTIQLVWSEENIENLAVHVWYRDTTRLVHLEDTDLERPVDELAAEIIKICKEWKP